MADKYVIDASALVDYFVQGQYTTTVTKLIVHLGQGTDLHIPEFGLLECGNVIWQRTRRTENRIEQQQALMLVNDLVDLPLIIGETLPLLPRALQIGLTHNLAIYDSLYIALAAALHAPLISVDQRQNDAARSAGVALKAITDFSSSDEGEG